MFQVYLKFDNACLNAHLGKMHENYAKCLKLDKSQS